MILEKNLVRMMLEGKGIEVIDLGVDVPAEEFIRCAVENQCDIICCSALLTTTMSKLGEVVELAKEAGIREKVKIMVGGAPVNRHIVIVSERIFIQMTQHQLPKPLIKC